LAEPETVALADTATPAMWRVTDADSEYILIGTFHILPPALNWRTDLLADAFNDAAVTYFEVDANAPDATAKTLNTVMSQGFNAPGASLAAMLETRDANKLRDIVKELSLPFAAVDTMRPWNAFLTLSVQFIINQGFDPGNGVDSVLLKEAKTAGKDVRYFETIEEQLSFFTGLAPAVEKDLLVITIRDWDKQAGAFDELFNAWASGDTDYIDVQMNEDMREQAPDVYQRLIVERNAAWANELDAALKNESGKGLVAVGAAHLVGGEFSVPALLAAKGYEVTRYGVEAASTGTPEEALAPDAANDNDPSE
ncbi:TraB/GumN family protein, partial [Hyphococcus sp.]|uniref:TraB/GumN family protein n=1 Tax=Hyphococcus sp. TaxID=2038636 RepID=UPI003753DD2A